MHGSGSSGTNVLCTGAACFLCWAGIAPDINKIATEIRIALMLRLHGIAAWVPTLFKQFHKRPGLASALPTPLRVPLGAGLVDHFFPDAFGLEDDLDEFTRGAFPAIGFGGVVGRPPHFWCGIVDGDRQSHAIHYGQVRQVIAKIGDFRFLRSGLAQDIFVSRDLVPLLLVDKLDIQLFTASAQSCAGAAGDDAGPQPGGNGQREALAVVSVNILQLKCGPVRLRQQREAAIGQCPIHVHQQDLNLLCSSRQFSRNFLSSLSQFISSFLSFFTKSRALASLGMTIKGLFQWPATSFSTSCYVFSVSTSVPASTNHANAPRPARPSLHP